MKKVIVALACLTTAVTLSACSGDNSPEPTPDVSTSTSASPTPTVEPTIAPPALGDSLDDEQIANLNPEDEGYWTDPDGNRIYVQNDEPLPGVVTRAMTREVEGIIEEMDFYAWKVNSSGYQPEVDMPVFEAYCEDYARIASESLMANSKREVYLIAPNWRENANGDGVELIWQNSRTCAEGDVTLPDGEENFTADAETQIERAEAVIAKENASGEGRAELLVVQIPE